MKPVAMAIAAHPDDIEFLMAGTLLQLGRAGWELHYQNLSSGCCGSLEHGRARTASIRLKEARAAAKILGAEFHPPMGDDLELFYDLKTLRRLAAVIREVKPTIVLVPSPQDYMEDHTNTCRLAVTAAFTRGMPNFRTTPPRPVGGQDVTIYHAMPHGLCDPLRRRVVPGQFVNTGPVHEVKRAALAAHRSQQGWLDATQRLNSYLQAMDDMSREVGRMSRLYRHAEGWRRHSHFGFCAESADPLRDALKKDGAVNARYEAGLRATTES